MRLFIYGDQGFESLESSYLRAAQALGLEVEIFDARGRPEAVRFWLRQRVLHRLTVHNLGWRRRGSRDWNQSLLAAVGRARPDLVLVVKGDFVMPETLEQIRRQLAPVFVLHPDSGVWVAHHAPGAPKATETGIYGRWRYVPSVGAFVVATDVDENVHFFKLGK